MDPVSQLRLSASMGEAQHRMTNKEMFVNYRLRKGEEFEFEF